VGSERTAAVQARLCRGRPRLPANAAMGVLAAWAREGAGR